MSNRLPYRPMSTAEFFAWNTRRREETESVLATTTDEVVAARLREALATIQETIDWAHRVLARDAEELIDAKQPPAQVSTPEAQEGANDGQA